MSFKVSDYDFKLPKELIAYNPVQRGQSRLLVVEREKNRFYEKKFEDITNILPVESLIVRNITKVAKARIYGKRETGGRVEILILDPFSESGEFKCLLKSRKRLNENDKIFIDDKMIVTVVKKLDEGFLIKVPFKNRDDFFAKYGHIPLPPYIKRNENENDEKDYQTCYAERLGSCAAPTAGLHFNEKIIETIIKKGIRIVDLVLHISLGTFKPVKVKDIREHKMHSEYFEIDDDVVFKLNRAKNDGKKIVSIGTTSLRALETVYDGKIFFAKKGFTNLLIYPPYKIKSVDILLTNFHLPKSTLLMLVSSFAGRELILDAYRYAIDNGFRFFSYGDAMLII